MTPTWIREPDDPHHAQAMQLVTLADKRQQLSREFRDLAEKVRTAQTPEIEQMAGWLADSDKKVPETTNDA